MRVIRKLAVAFVSRRALWGLMILVTLVAVVWQVENWRGRARWAAVRERIADQGYSWDWRDYYPEPVSEADNASYHPVFANLFELHSDGSRRLLRFDAFWQRVTRAGEALGAAGDLQILETTADLGAMAEEWAEAFSRPRCQWFPVDVRNLGGDGGLPFPAVPSIGNVTGGLGEVSPLFRQRTLAHLRAGDPDAARREWLGALGFYGSMREGASLVEMLVHLAMTGIVAEDVGAVVTAAGWRESDLAAMAEVLQPSLELEKVDRHLRSEMVGGIHTAIAFAEGEGWARDAFTPPDADNPSLPWWAERGPKGWMYQSMASYVERWEREGLSAYDASRNRFRPQALEDGERDLIPVPYDFLSHWMMPTFGSIYHHAAEVQSRAGLVQVACAIRRYELAEGRLPGSLANLVPRFLEAVPEDLITGEPVGYQTDGDAVELVALGGEVSLRFGS